MKVRRMTLEKFAASDARLSREEALQHARAMVPILRERADRCAEERNAPPETIQEMKDRGLLRLLQPARYGGSEQGWDVFCEVIQILAAGCGSQAWVYRVLGDHAKMIGTFPARAQEDVWGEDWDTQASSCFAPVGRAKVVSGGYLLSGRYNFSSGIDHAQWVICGGLIEDSTRGGGVAHYFLVPKSDVEIVDDWFVSGLEGSGSKSFTIKEALVPSHRVLEWSAAGQGTGPGTRVNKAPVFRLPRGNYTTSGFAALQVGMAQGMFADWLALTAGRKSEGIPVATQESIQIVAGSVGSELAAAEALYLGMIREAMRMLEEGCEMSSEHAVMARAQVSYTCQLALSAANRMRDAMGSSAVYRNPTERQFRNILAGVQHLAINWPKCAALYGASLLGVSEEAPGVQ